MSTRLPIYLLAIPAAALAACRVRASADGPPVVMAAASLKEIVTQAADAGGGGARPVLLFDASSTLARQIREGARCDLFITADPRWLDGLAPLERFDWLGNRLVAVVARGAKDGDWRHAASLALAGEQVPAGIYARAALERLAIAPPARVIHGASVRDVLSKVAEGGADAGIVYATDAAIEPRVVVSFVFPQDSHPPIVYAAALMTEAGRALYLRLKTPEVKAMARTLGFTDPAR